MAANPEAGGANYALPGVMRALLRAVVLSGLVAVGWLLGSGLSHADEDPGLPGVGQIHVVSAGSDAEPSAGIVGRPAAGSIVERILSDAAAPRLSVQPIEKIGVLRPIVHALGNAKPVIDVLTPLPRPLSAPAPHRTAVRSAAPTAKVAPMSPPAPAITPAVAAAAAPDPALTSLRRAAPTVVPCLATVAFAQSVPAQPAVSEDPRDPAPARPPGSTSTPCMIGSTSSGSNSKNASDFATHDSWASGNLARSDGPLLLSGSDLPRSLALKPSTSPD
ncbi:MAG: hypothetical protein M3319_10495 [Actinomycetota bacterium]|nr:hypothetical protein [Actinomycetota bacterium]MDQ3900837.1 hypothetical protein [Actinomycetota bacterium]